MKNFSLTSKPGTSKLGNGPNYLERMYDWLCFETRRFAYWVNDELYRRVLLLAEELRRQLQLTDVLPLYPLPPEFVVLCSAGVGTFSDIYLALMPANARYPLVALKRVLVEDGRNGFKSPLKYDAEDFVRVASIKMHEVKMLRWFQGSSRIVNLACDTPALPFDTMVLEPMGCALRDVLNARHGRVPMWFVVPMGLELFLGLLEIHGVGMVHGDLKPSNVMFFGDCRRIAGTLEVCFLLLGFLCFLVCANLSAPLLSLLVVSCSLLSTQTLRRYICC
jgi:serine/threonine protein kinase